MNIHQALLPLSPDFGLPLTMQPCVFCGSSQFEVLASQDRHLLGLVTAGCTRCGLVQTNPRPDAAGLADFYAHHYRKVYQGVVDPSKQYVVRFRKDERLRYTVAHLTQALGLRDEGVLLDYGCGEGSLFAALRAGGFRGRLAGVEPNANFARYAAEVGQADVRPTLDGFEQLDAVVVNHVLEHLADPLGVLRDIRRRLKPEGVLYIDVPDTDRYAHVGDLHLAHILHFTARTLPALVKAAGYEVVYSEAHDPPYHPRSLRLGARPAAQHAVPAAFNVEREYATWKHLRAIEARKWRWTLSRRLARIGPVRAAYHALRDWATPVARA